MNLDINIKTHKIKAILIEDCIIENKITENSCIDVYDVIAIKQENLKLANGKKYAVLVTPGQYSTITKEARELVSSYEFTIDTIAKALIVNSLAHRIIGNFYIKVNKPFIKTQIFTDKEKAIIWLRNQLNQIRF